jgi:hypothetical protein
MRFTAEELAIYGLIDAETYIRLTEAMITGSATVRGCLPKLDRRACERIMARAAQRWRERLANSAATLSAD